MRTFIALDIPDNIKEKIFIYFDKEREKWREMKWVEKENLHITLKFLGEVEEEKIPLISKILDDVSKRFESFNLKLDKVGFFPSLKSPRVLWVGVYPEENVKKLFDFLEKELEKLGFERERREFHPHITVARFKKRNIFKMEEKKLGDSFKANEVVLFKSNLTPDGPIYTPLKKVRLKNG